MISANDLRAAVRESGEEWTDQQVNLLPEIRYPKSLPETMISRCPLIPPTITRNSTLESLNPLPETFLPETQNPNSEPYTLNSEPKRVWRGVD